jgi:hypothetical protein
MPTERDPESIKAVPLSYATAGNGGVSARRIFTAICAILVAIFSLLCFFIGINFCVAGLRVADLGLGYWNQANARGAGFIIVGVLCLRIAMHRGREGFGRAKG